MISHRVILLGHPASWEYWLLRNPYPSRNPGWGTEYRGPVAFVCTTRDAILGTAQLVGISRPFTGGFWWQFEHLTPLERPIPVGIYANDIWDTPRGLEPPFLGAGDNLALNNVLKPVAEPETDFEALYRSLKEKNL